MLDSGEETHPLLDYYHVWTEFFVCLMEMAGKRGMSTYVVEVGFARVYPENNPYNTLEGATCPFQKVVIAQRKTRIPLIQF